MSVLKSLAANPKIRAAAVVLAGTLASAAAGYLQGHAILGGSSTFAALALREVAHLLDSKAGNAQS